MSEVKKSEQKYDTGTIFVFSAIALLFSWIVTKDVSIPPAILYGGFAFGGIVLFFKGLNNPAIVTYVLVAYLPFSRVLVGDFGGLAAAVNLTNLLMGFIIFVWINGRYSDGEPLWLNSNMNGAITLFIILGLISIVRGQYYGSGHVLNAITEFKRWITPVFLFFLVLNTVKDKGMIRNIIAIICIVTTIVGLMAIYDYMNVGVVSRLEKARIGGISEQPNQLAAFFNYYMFIVFAFFLMNMNKLKYWLLLIPFLICFRGIMVTFSRGGYIAFAMGLYAIIWFKSKFLFMLLLLATVIVFLNPQLLPGGIRYRMSQTIENSHYDDPISEESLEKSSQTRVEIWKAAFVMIEDHPFFGVGYDLFQPMINYYWDGGRKDAHNQYILLAAEMGIVGLLSFLWILWLMFWNTYRLYKRTEDSFTKATALGILGGFFGLLMSNMFGSRLGSQEIASYLWILMALVIRLRILDDREREKSNPRPTQKITYALEDNYT